jgi:hypothetical protein
MSFILLTGSEIVSISENMVFLVEIFSLRVRISRGKSRKSRRESPEVRCDESEGR